MLREPHRPHIKHQRGLWAPPEHAVPGARPALSAGRLAPVTTPAPSPLSVMPRSRHAAPGPGTRRTPLPARPPSCGAEANRQDGRDTAGGQAEVGQRWDRLPETSPRGPVCARRSPRGERTKRRQESNRGSGGKERCESESSEARKPSRCQRRWSGAGSPLSHGEHVAPAGTGGGGCVQQRGGLRTLRSIGSAGGMDSCQRVQARGEQLPRGQALA